MYAYEDFDSLLESIPVGCRLGIINFSKKHIGEFHAGHSYMINKAKMDCDILVCCLYDYTYVFGDLYPNNFFFTERVWDRDYCIEWMDNNQVEYVFIPDSEYFKDQNIRQRLNILDAQTTIDNVLKSDIYIDLPTNLDFHENRFSLLEIFINENFRPKTSNICEYCAWRFDISPFLKRHYCLQNSLHEVKIFAPFRREDGLIYSSQFFCNLEQTKLQALISCNNYIKNFFEDETIVNNKEITLLDLNQFLGEYFYISFFGSVRNQITNDRDFVYWRVFDKETGNFFKFGELF